MDFWVNCFIITIKIKYITISSLNDAFLSVGPNCNNNSWKDSTG